MITLRDYQSAAIQSIYDWFEADKHAPLIVTPTGSGKSVILAEFIRRAISEWPDTRILVVTHVRELVEQDTRAILSVWPLAPVGIWSAGLNKKQHMQITVASIQSCYKEESFFGAFDLIIVDEAHLIPHASAGMYRALLQSMAAANSHVRLIGLTATPYRLDSGMLHQGDGALFDGISYEANVADLIEQGWLSPLTAKHGADVDLSGIGKVGGDYNQGQLGARMSALELVGPHADRIIVRCAGRKSWLVFCVTVEHAQVVAVALQDRGIAADYVHGGMPKGIRDQRIADFKSGKLQALANCNILTTGFDYPAIDAIVMLRPTLSLGLYVQMVGRGLRKADGKADCLVLDFGGNVRNHGFIDAIDPPRKTGHKVKMPTKVCPECEEIVRIALMTCPSCGHVWQPVPQERKNETEHHAGEMLARNVKPETVKVDRVAYRRHVAASGIPTMMVTYFLGMQNISEWICFEHRGYAREKASAWWHRRAGNMPPATVDEALERVAELAQPESVVATFTGRYPEIKSYKFPEAVTA